MIHKSNPIVHIGSGAAALAVLMTSLLAGCDGGDEWATAPVRGSVLLDGEPVPTGTVTFVPDGPGPTASGNIGPDGTFELTTYDEGDGAILGKHRVMITAFDEGSGLPEEATSTPKLIVPERYSRDRTSGLTAEVEKGENEVKFELTER